MRRGRFTAGDARARYHHDVAESVLAEAVDEVHDGDGGVPVLQLDMSPAKRSDVAHRGKATQIVGGAAAIAVRGIAAV